MDTLLVDYCKQNKIIYANYSHKLQDFNQSVAVMLKMLDCTKEVIYRIDFNKVNKRFSNLFRQKMYPELDTLDNMVMFIYKKTSRMTNDTTIITKRVIDDFLANDCKNCPICLTTAMNLCLFCPTCNAKYHYECITDPNYPCKDKEGDLACCCCKQTMNIKR